jgi:acetyl-CoA acyltransferase
MKDVFIAGAFVTPFGKFPDVSLRALASRAAEGALADAGATPDVVDAVYFGNAADGVLAGQEMIRGQVALQDTGLLGVPVVNVENACASSSTAFQLATVAVAAGAADVVLVVGAEKLTNPDKSRTFGVFNTALDIQRYGPSEGPATKSVFMDVYAQMSRDYMARSGATLEDFAAIAVKSHANGALNANAQYRDPLTTEQVLSSREISDPLTLLMCSPIGDGAAALVVASADGLARLEAEPIRVRAAVLRSGRVDEDQADGPVVRAAQAAYREAGLEPNDVDVVEMHDAAAPAELFVAEEIGVAPHNEAPTLLRAGETSLGGRVPINPSGGLLSRGHPVGATGCAQLVELTDQLRGRCGARQVEGADVALAENAGGWMGNGPAVATIAILSR